MNPHEGVIKFDLDFRPAPAPPAEALGELEAWRTIFRRLGLLGQDPSRYEGLGFGNLSRRTRGDGFLISGTQTGFLERLDAGHYVEVSRCDPASNRVVAAGSVRPSSEALSHGALYQADPRINWVMHLHSPELYRAGTRLGLPATDPVAPYGSPQMAAEICRQLPAAGWPGLLLMGGHEDGIFAFGATARETGALVVAMLAAALTA